MVSKGIRNQALATIANAQAAVNGMTKRKMVNSTPAHRLPISMGRVVSPALASVTISLVLLQSINAKLIIDVGRM